MPSTAYRDSTAISQHPKSMLYFAERYMYKVEKKIKIKQVFLEQLEACHLPVESITSCLHGHQCQHCYTKLAGRNVNVESTSENKSSS